MCAGQRSVSQYLALSLIEFEAGSLSVSVTGRVLQTSWPVSFQTILLSLPPTSLGSGIHMCPLFQGKNSGHHLRIGSPPHRAVSQHPVSSLPVQSHSVLEAGPLVPQDGFELLTKQGDLGLQAFLPLPPQYWVYPSTKLGFMWHWG